LFIGFFFFAMRGFDLFPSMTSRSPSRERRPASGAKQLLLFFSPIFSFFQTLRALAVLFPPHRALSSSCCSRTFPFRRPRAYARFPAKFPFVSAENPSILVKMALIGAFFPFLGNREFHVERKTPFTEAAGTSPRLSLDVGSAPPQLLFS